MTRISGEKRPSDGDGEPDRRLALTALGLAFGLCLLATTTDHTPPAAVMVAVAVASALSGIAGFAFSAICGAILFHLSANQVQIVETMIVCSVANQVVMVWSVRRDVDWRHLIPFLLGGFAGLPFGAWILLNIAREIYVHWLGAFLIGYGTYMLLRRPIVVRHQSPVFDALAGFLGGITGGAIGFPGAFVAIWCGFKGWSKERQRAVFQPFILIMQVIALVTIAAMRSSPHVGLGIEWGNLLCVPGSLLGTAIGLHLYRRLSDAHFVTAVNVLLIISGISLAV